jgi:hypothetical protein
VLNEKILISKLNKTIKPCIYIKSSCIVGRLLRFWKYSSRNKRKNKFDFDSKSQKNDLKQIFQENCQHHCKKIV